MKKYLTIIVACVCISATTYAADLIVAEGGSGGAYSSIGAAITAATSGDRIIIYPKAGGATWNENVSLTNKSLQLLSATEGQYWKLNGNITLTPSAAGMSFTIMGCHITSGNISASAAAPAGSRAKVTIMGCKLTSGFIYFDFNQYDLNVAADSVMAGYIYLRYGKVMGNYVNAGSACTHGIYVGSDGSGSDNFVHIVGNRVYCSTSSCTNYGIQFNSSAFFYNISNNYVKHNASNQNPIYIANSRSSTAQKNRIMNNTIVLINNSNLGAYISSLNSNCLFYNNVVFNTAGTGGYGFGVSANSNMFEASYNYVNASSAANAFYQFTNDGTNVNNITFTYDNTTGQVLTGPPINGGSPDLQYSDLDLTRNDAGSFGGSWSMANFLNQSTTSAQVTFFDAPGRILTGQTINITGEGFDK